MSAAILAASGHLPRRALVASSHAVTALTRTSVASSSIAVCARRESFGSSVSHQNKTWLSRRTFTGAVPEFQFFLGQRIEEERVRQVVFSLQQAGLAPPLL